MDGLEYQLNDPEDMPKNNNKCSNITKIIRRILICIIVLLILFLIIMIFIAKNMLEKRDELKEKLDIANSTKEKDKDNLHWEIYGKKISNISYADNNGKILNSFKKSGENYKEKLGEINNGLDYDKNDRNIYDLYIPYYALERKLKYNRIILNIHGGCWAGGSKEVYDKECKEYLKSGFICATMSYTLLIGYNNSNIFRILDEIISVVKNIKNYLKNEGFNENKLELVLSGGSAGAHLSLYYAYTIKNSTIPVKFVMNGMGPVTLDFNHWLKVKNIDEPLENIDPYSIQKAYDEGKLEIIKRDINNISPIFLAVIMNLFIGGKLGDDLGDIIKDKENLEINTESEKYIKMLEKAQFGFPYLYVDKDSPPTICFYGGKDIDVGIAQYSLLKKKFDENNNNNIKLIYSKYSSHEYIDYETEDGKNKQRDCKICNLYACFG